MSKIRLILALAILVIIVIPITVTTAQSRHIAHEDPGSAETSYDISLSILLHYSDILNALANGEYEDIGTLTDQIDLDNANIPEDIRYIIQTYNSLLIELSSELNNLDVLMNEVEELLNEDKLEEANLKIIDASRFVDEAGSLLVDIQDVNIQLINALGTFASIYDTETVEDANNKLEAAIARLNTLKEIYMSSLRELDDKADQIKNIISTELYIEAPAQASVGDPIVLSGVLTSTGEEELPLSNKNIEILLNDQVIAITSTDTNGYYKTEAGEIVVPHLYSPILKVQASYVPEGNDITKYLSSTSPVSEIDVQFYTTELTLDLRPTELWAGETITVSGILTSPKEAKPLPNRDIAIFLDNANISTATTGADGKYVGTISIPYEYITSRTIEVKYLSIDDEYASSSILSKEIKVKFYTTELSFNLSSTEPWVGDTVTVSGTLTSPDEAGKPLSNKIITILLDDIAIDTATTGSDGTYELEIKVPYEYVATRTMQVIYSYEAVSPGSYQPCASNSVNVNISFLQSHLQVETPEQAYPGLPLSISGEITDESDTTSLERVIRLLLDDEPIDILYLSQNTFTTEFLVDIEATNGEHLLTVTIDPLERYNGVSVNKTVIITQQSFEVEINDLVFTTPPRKIKIEGKLTSELPVKEEAVTIELRGVSTTVLTSDDGSFHATLNLPLNSIIMGNQQVCVMIEPSEAWHLTTSTESDIFIIDVFNIVLTSAVFICIGLVIYTTRKNKTAKESISILNSSSTYQKDTDATVRKSIEIEGNRAKVLIAYIESLGIVEKSTGIAMKPHMTLREYLDVTMPKLRNAVEPFTELTHLTEDALYSSNILKSDKNNKAESLASIIKERLRHDWS